MKHASKEDISLSDYMDRKHTSLVTDKSTERDVDKFCEFLGHKLVEKIISVESLYFVVQKKDKNII